MSLEESGKTLTKGDVLKRLREVWDVIDLRRKGLTKGETYLINYNLELAKLWLDIHEGFEDGSAFRVGFGETDGENVKER